MPTVLSKLFSADKRVYLYGAILAISTVGLIHFKQALSNRNELQILTQQTSINQMDLITTELPLLIAPFAGIDTIHYVTQIAYHLINKQSIHPHLLKQCIISSFLGFGLPLIYVFRNKNMRAKDGIRTGFRRFVYHFGSISFCFVIGGSTYRVFLWSLKYLLSSPFLICGSVLLYKAYVNIAEYTVSAFCSRLAISALCGVIGSKIYVGLGQYEKYRMNKIYTGMASIVKRTWTMLVWNDVELKYMLLCGVVLANLFNFVMDSVLSKYFMPFSFKIRNRFSEQNAHWIYDSYYHYMNDVNNALPKEIYCEIFSFAGIEYDFRLWIENDQCRIQYEEKHLYMQELSILAHICFSYISYRELYHRIKSKPGIR